MRRFDDIHPFHKTILILGYIILAFLVMLLHGCAVYSFENSSVTKYPDGREISSVCKVSINSSREIKEGGLKVSEDCALGGKANKAGVNDQVIKMINLIVQAAAAAAK